MNKGKTALLLYILESQIQILAWRLAILTGDFCGIALPLHENYAILQYLKMHYEQFHPHPSIHYSQSMLYNVYS
jgi:hypothetical protein